MTTIILMQTNIGASIGKSYQRIIATIFGLLFGLLFAILVHKNMMALYSVFPLLLFAFIYTTVFSATLPIFIVSAIIGIIFTYFQPNPWTFILWRIIDTGAGAIISIGAIMIFFPVFAKKDFRQTTILNIKKAQQLINEQITNLIKQEDNPENFTKKVIEYENTLVKMRQNYNDASLEFSAISIAKEASLSVVIALERIHNLLLSLRLLFTDLSQVDFMKEITFELNNFIAETTKTAENLIAFVDHKHSKPNFTNVDRSLDQLKNHLLDGNQHCVGAPIFLYCNLFAYVSELRHIANAVNELHRIFEYVTNDH